MLPRGRFGGEHAGADRKHQKPFTMLLFRGERFSGNMEKAMGCMQGHVPCLPGRWLGENTHELRLSRGHWPCPEEGSAGKHMAAAKATHSAPRWEAQ